MCLTGEQLAPHLPEELHRSIIWSVPLVFCVLLPEVDVELWLSCDGYL